LRISCSSPGGATKSVRKLAAVPAADASIALL
jgi:hypothetical protein